MLAFWLRCGAVAMATGHVKKQGLKNGFRLFKENPVIRFSSFQVGRKLMRLLINNKHANMKKK